MYALSVKQLHGRGWMVVVFFTVLFAGILAEALERPQDPLPEPKNSSGEPDKADNKERRRIVALHIIDTKERVLAKLVNGQWSLHEAAKCFQVLDEGKENSPGHSLHVPYPGATVVERYCHAVLDRLQNSSTFPSGPQGEQIRKRLEAELAGVPVKPRDKKDD